MFQSAMPVMCRALVPEVLPAVMPVMPAVPEVLPAPPPALVLPGRLPADLPAAGRAALAVALAGAVPGGRPERGELARAAGPACWDGGECARLRGFLESVADPRDPRGRVYPLSYLLALPLVAGMAGDDELDAAGEWIASAPEEVLARLGAPRDRAGRAGRPDATTLGRVLARADQCQYDDALCSWAAARARAQRPGLRKHLRIDGKALRGARRDGRAPMLLSGIWDDGTTAAQLPVSSKTNEIPVFRQLLGKIPGEELRDTVITADQMHTQREHARQIARKNGHYVFTIGENQPGLFAAADALCWESVAVEAWTADRGHGRTDVRTIKTMPPTARISALFPHVRQVFLVERYSYGPDGSLLSAVAVPGITSLAPYQADPGDLLAYLRGHWAIEMHHYVRDVCFGEDASRVSRAHTGQGRHPQHHHRHLAPAPDTEPRRAAAHQPPRPLPAPAAAPRPHHTTGAADRKPRRDLNATNPPHPGTATPPHPPGPPPGQHKHKSAIRPAKRTRDLAAALTPWTFALFWYPWSRGAICADGVIATRRPGLAQDP
ncbi:MAG: ISAs1 family transposase [Streptosporangiaceae bacterium]